MQCVIYARDAVTDPGCEMQLQELRGYVERRGWVLAGEYVDSGCSGTKTERPHQARLMKDVRARRVDYVIVWTMDRWGRTIPNCFALIEELRAMGIGWIAINQAIHIKEGNPLSTPMLKLMAACRDFGREMHREETRAGMRVAKRDISITCGRPRLVFDRYKIAEMRQAGESIRAIAKKLGVGAGTVHRLLSVPKG